MKLINEEIIAELNEMGKRIDIFEEYIHNPENYGENYNSIEDKEIRSLVIQLYVYYNILIDRCKRLNIDLSETLLSRYNTFKKRFNLI